VGIDIESLTDEQRRDLVLNGRYAPFGSEADESLYNLYCFQMGERNGMGQPPIPFIQWRASQYTLMLQN